MILSRFPDETCGFRGSRRGHEPDNTAPAIEVPDYRPVERFWPYVDLPEQPTDEELAALNPELSEALFGTPRLPFSVTLDFPQFDGPDYPRAVDMARRAAEYRGDRDLPLAAAPGTFLSPDAAMALRDLFELVGRLDACDVLIDDRPVPYAASSGCRCSGSSSGRRLDSRCAATCTFGRVVAARRSFWASTRKFSATCRRSKPGLSGSRLNTTCSSRAGRRARRWRPAAA